jgi:flagellar basal body-associated protein FliL
MDEKKTNSEAPIKDADAKENKSNKFVFIGILAGVVLLNALAAFLLFQMTRPASQDDKRAKIQADSLKKVEENATVMGATTEKPIEAIVNISGTDGQRFLKAAVLFEFDDQTYPDLGVELDRRAPKFKNLLIDHLSRLTLIEVSEPDAKERIRKDFLKVVNSTLPAKLGEIREVFFTTYIIQ